MHKGEMADTYCLSFFIALNWIFDKDYHTPFFVRTLESVASFWRVNHAYQVRVQRQQAYQTVKERACSPEKAKSKAHGRDNCQWR